MKVHIGEIDPGRLGALKRSYLAQTTAALDGMWLTGLIPMAKHFGFYEGDALVGYCCVNDDGYLLQLHMTPEHQSKGSEVLDAIVAGALPKVGAISGAFASTAEPRWLSWCLDRFTTFEVHTLMYQLERASSVCEESASHGFSRIEAAQLEEAVSFVEANVGGSTAWLEGYLGNLIERGELFGHFEGGRLIATGECRGNDLVQTEYADLGMIVDESARGRGLATRVMKGMIAVSESRGLRPICSTEKTNVAAQKAIERAGFFAGHRIVRFLASDSAQEEFSAARW